MSVLLNKNIIVGVTGGIAAYKAMTLVRRLKDAGARVQVVMTESAKAFVTPLSFQAVSGLPVRDSLLDTDAEAAMGHIELARWADAIVIAPATANSIARMAHGEADDLLTTLVLASRSAVAVAPAMNQAMWSKEATQANIRQLQQQGVSVWGPASGTQACGDEGEGRMLEPEAIAENVTSLFASEMLAGVRVVVTAGPTHEAIDPVRYIANRSSGKMGYALSEALAEAGAVVELVSGPVALVVPDKVSVHRVESAGEMFECVHKRVSEADIFISVAAVADYRVSTPAPGKIKKENETLTLELVKNPDILASVSALQSRPFCVGFAAETEQLETYALSKLASKNLDMIIANRVDSKETGFGSDYNAATVFWKQQEALQQQEFERMTKFTLSRELVELIAQQFKQK